MIPRQLDMFAPAVQRSAVLSACGRYRYRLTRTWGAGPCLSWIMLNPSTADAEVDDPTIRRCVAFSRREGYGGLEVVNLFAWRATDPRELARVDDPIGPENGHYLIEALGSGAVAAWGANQAATTAGLRLADLVPDHPVLRCLGTTKDGAPRHPLYVASDTPFFEWTPQ